MKCPYHVFFHKKDGLANSTEQEHQNTQLGLIWYCLVILDSFNKHKSIKITMEFYILEPNGLIKKIIEHANFLPKV